MLDSKFVRENPDKVATALKNRGLDLSLDGFLALEKQRRELLVEVEALKSKRNTVSQEISRLKKSGTPAEDMIAEMRSVGDRIALLDGDRTRRPTPRSAAGALRRRSISRRRLTGISASGSASSISSAAARLRAPASPSTAAWAPAWSGR